MPGGSKQGPDDNFTTWWVRHTTMVSVVLGFVTLHETMESGRKIRVLSW